MPHPGWRHRVPEGVVVLRDQAAALARLEELVDREIWRADKRAAWTVMAQTLIHGMSWDSGLVAGVTRAHLAERAGVGLRTVTSLLAWAQDVGLLVCVETGATAAFLGTETNRAPSYVLTVPRGWEQPAQWVRPTALTGSDGFGDGGTLSVPPKPAQSPVGKSCHPPASSVRRSSPRQERGLQRSHDNESGVDSPSWPVFDLARTATERARAVATLLDRAGMSARVPQWRAVALLAPWFAEGWSVMGLLHALDHHPDRPGVSRGDAARAARDPLRIVGHRLSPWRGRLADVPVALSAVERGHNGHRPRPDSGHRPRAEAATLATRTAAADEIGRLLAARAENRPSRRRLRP